jgi:thiol-disulfide isomerase/thioredoxin
MGGVEPHLRQRIGRALALAAALLLLAACRGPRPEPVDLVLPRADNGQPFSFAATRGEATLVFFFSTWCVPCQAMEASVGEVARRGKDEGIEVVAVALDLEERRTVAPYVWATKPPYPVVVGGGEVARGESPFGKIPELPAVMFLDRDGRPSSVLAGFTSPDDLLRRARDVKGR